MKHMWSILCRRAIIDQSTQLVSLFEVIDALPAPENAGEGLLAVEADFVTVWERDEEGRGELHNARITVFDAKDIPLGTPLVQTINLESTPRVRATTRFPGFPIRGLGTHTLRLEVEKTEDDSWETVVDYEVRVVSVTSLAQAAVQEGR
jgi:hypothetical protein